MTTLDYLGHIRTESQRFLAVLGDVDPRAHVPSCPDWDAEDLLWHLAEVQWFWASVVEGRLQHVDGVEGPDRPADRERLLSFMAEQSDRLVTVLGAADPTEQVYMWAEDKAVGYIRRRQAHEALIHRLDAELAAGTVTPLDPALASDGVHETLAVMFGGCPPWGTFTPSGTQVEVVAEDTGLVVPVALGRFTGTDPASGTAYDEPDVSVSAADPTAPAHATVRGTADDLDAWLWHRRNDSLLHKDGDPGVLAAFTAVLAQPLT